MWAFSGAGGDSRLIHVVRDTVVEGEPYVVVSDERVVDGRPAEAHRHVVRYDRPSSRVVAWTDGGGRSVSSLSPCPLALPDDALVTCDEGGLPWRAGEDAGPLPSLGMEAPVRNRSFASTLGFSFYVLAEGIGPVLYSDARSFLRLTYARVGGKEHGAAASPLPPPPEADLWPNPTAGDVTLRYSPPEPGPVTADVYDALGRRVAEAPLPPGPGPRTARLNVPSALPPGAYVVRVRAPSGVVAVARFVRIRR